MTENKYKEINQYLVNIQLNLTKLNKPAGYIQYLVKMYAYGFTNFFRSL